MEDIIEQLKKYAIQTLDSVHQPESRIPDALNAEFALGEFNGITKLLRQLDYEKYISLLEKTAVKREELLKIVSRIFEEKQL